MGQVIKQIVGDCTIDSKYTKFTIEDNADRKVHIHMGNLRLDLTRDDYNIFYDGMLELYEGLNRMYNWDD